MLGKKVFQAELLIDPEGNEGVFFLIDTLAIRRLGLYKLRFSLNELFGYKYLYNRPVTQALAVVYSDTFEVKSALKFTKLMEKSELYMALTKQLK
jgi:hypothetical protein